MSAAAAVFSRRHRARFGNGHVSTAVFSSVEFLNRVRGFRVAGHLNETESLASTGIAIRDDLGGLNASRLSEDFLECFICRAERKVADV